ncbi:membrane biogenesis protein [Candidatus Woesearchaeota archaeon]|jgi:uncharacterized protein|nr:membrane biogenesis protein [Candidatus Woesearchaeota archaeon]MBT7237928.1 membrane biogenesis protein [Candidatus Woesearchaeota archaeon]
MTELKYLFPAKPLIGMIHLAGGSKKEKIELALSEMKIYQEEGINGVIIEDYHGSPEDVVSVLHQISKYNFKIIKGINLLRNPIKSFDLAKEFGAKFVQFDSVQTPNLNLELYQTQRKKHKHMTVLGGVGFKYIPPTGNTLEKDLIEGKSRCEAIVTTGSGTGIETPLDKLREFKNLLGEFPLIIGAGVNLENIRSQLMIGDGAIIGSYFKPQGNTQLPVDRMKVRSLVEAVRSFR